MTPYNHTGICLCDCNECNGHDEDDCISKRCTCCGERPLPKRYWCNECNVEVKSWHFAGEHGLNSDGAIKQGVAKIIEETKK